MSEIIENGSETFENEVSDTLAEDTIEKFKSQLEDAVSTSNMVAQQHLSDFSYANNCLVQYLDYKSFTENYLKNHITPYDKDLPEVTPYYTYEEYINIYKDEIDDDPDLTNIPVNPYLYAFVDDPITYKDKVKDLQVLYSTTSEENKDKVRKALIRCGWNPDIEINTDSIKEARQKQLNWFKENKNIDILHLEDYETENQIEYDDRYIRDEEIDSMNEAKESTKGKILEPVYIVLQYAGSTFGKLVNWWTKADWSHSGISFDSNLDRVYSFNAHHYFRHGETGKLGGFSVESIKDWIAEGGDKTKVAVLAIFVPNTTKKKMVKNIQFWKDHKNDTKYGFDNLVNIMINKSTDTGYSMAMVCSQFVDNILKLSNIDITKKNSNLVNPGDFLRAARENEDGETIRIYELYNGFAKDYSPKKLRQKIEVLKHKLSYNKMLVYNPSKLKLESYSLDNISEAMVKLLIPRSVCYEYKLPFSFDKTGNLTIVLPKDLQREYNEAHRLLSMYDVSNIDAIKHELARLFYINTIIEYKLKKEKKGTKEYKELEDLRARVLNDFTTYFKVVKSADKNFDFNRYFSTTEYYTKNIEIDNDTISYTSQIVKKLFKAIK